MTMDLLPGFFPEIHALEEQNKEKSLARVESLSSASMPGELPRPAVGRSHRCRADGLQQASVHRTGLHARLLAAYQQRDWTDAELSKELQLSRTTVIARRHELPQIVEKGTRKNPESGVNNTVWGFQAKEQR